MQMVYDQQETILERLENTRCRPVHEARNETYKVLRPRLPEFKLGVSLRRLTAYFKYSISLISTGPHYCKRAYFETNSVRSRMLVELDFRFYEP